MEKDSKHCNVEVLGCFHTNQLKPSCLPQGYTIIANIVLHVMNINGCQLVYSALDSPQPQRYSPGDGRKLFGSTTRSFNKKDIYCRSLQRSPSWTPRKSHSAGGKKIG